MIRKVKQKIRNYLTAKYDALYLAELENQVMSYHTWTEEEEASFKEKEEEIIWDLEQDKLQREENIRKTAVVSYEEITSVFEPVKVPADAFLEKEASDSKEKLLEEKEFVILAEDVKRVSKEAIVQLAQIFQKNAGTEVIYCDEDEVNHEETVRMNPWFKPDYSPDTLLSYFYFGNVVAVRKNMLQKAVDDIYKNNPFVQEMADNNKKKQNVACKTGTSHKKILYLLILEICKDLKREQIEHVKKILYSSHNITYWGFEEEYREIREYYNKQRGREEVDGVSIVIPSKDNPKVLERCLKSIFHWTKDVTYEVIVVDNGSNSENKAEIETMQDSFGFSYVYQPMEFNFSKMCNKGAECAKYPMLLFLNDDCEVRGTKWLSHMTDLAAVKTTGAVGAKLYYPESKRLQHCGIYNIHLGPVHKLQFKEDVRPYYDRRNLDVRNVLAVTAACLMIRKNVFVKINGFDETLQVAFNDVDLCYKLYKAGYNNVVDNEVHLWHHESLSRGSDESPAKLKRLMAEKQKLHRKHPVLWEADPYYHPGLTSEILDTGYSFDYEYPKHKHLAVEHPVRMDCLPAGTREDACVAPMIEYAGDLKGWFLEDSLVAKIEETMGTKKAAYLQGNVVVLGSDNACFEKMLLLRHETTGALYKITPEWYYRPDVYANLQDQQNVALSGFACFVNMSDMPLGRYEVGILVKDKISKQHLLRVTTRSIELE